VEIGEECRSGDAELRVCRFDGDVVAGEGEAARAAARALSAVVMGNADRAVAADVVVEGGFRLAAEGGAGMPNEGAGSMAYGAGTAPCGGVLGGAVVVVVVAADDGLASSSSVGGDNVVK